jgi:CDP-diacylglycerol--glycerol-3-phosphate 3-phosphatidyltransferase
MLAAMRINLPLALTMGRVVAIPVVLGLFYVHWPHARQWACALFVLAAFTDWLDGYLARKWNQTSKFGAFLDPVADKLIVAVSLVMLLRDEPGGVMAVLVAIIIGREITISALREWLAELGQRTTVAVSAIGKVKTAFQMTSIGLMLWQQPLWGLPLYQLGYACLFVAAALTIWSMAIYLKAAWPFLKESMPQ